MSGQAFWVAARFVRARYMARAIRQAVRTVPAYTFTAEGSRAYRPFAWFDEPVVLVEGADGQQLLQTLRWQIRAADSGGKVPVGLSGFLVAAGSLGWDVPSAPW
jgi:hypothetical protein